jgi:hypothetical protein
MHRSNYVATSTDGTIEHRRTLIDKIAARLCQAPFALTSASFNPRTVMGMWLESQQGVARIQDGLSASYGQRKRHVN